MFSYCHIAYTCPYIVGIQIRGPEESEGVSEKEAEFHTKGQNVDPEVLRPTVCGIRICMLYLNQACCGKTNEAKRGTAGVPHTCTIVLVHLLFPSPPPFGSTANHIRGVRG